MEEDQAPVIDEPKMDEDQTPMNDEPKMDEDQTPMNDEESTLRPTVNEANTLHVVRSWNAAQVPQELGRLPFIGSSLPNPNRSPDPSDFTPPNFRDNNYDLNALTVDGISGSINELATRSCLRISLTGEIGDYRAHVICYYPDDPSHVCPARFEADDDDIYGPSGWIRM